MADKWEDDDTLVAEVIFNTERVVIDGLHVRFRDDIDYDSLPRGRDFKLGDEHIFMVIPTHSWNSVHRVLHTLPQEQLRRFGIGQSYRIHVDDITHQISDQKPLVRFLLKMNLEYADYDFVNTVRWCRKEAIDAETYPFVIQTQACWNNYQHLLDEYGVRDTVRAKAGYPLAIPVGKKRVYRIKHDAFNKLKAEIEQ